MGVAASGVKVMGSLKNSGKKAVSEKFGRSSDPEKVVREKAKCCSFHSGLYMLLLRAASDSTGFPDEINKLIAQDIFAIKKKRAFLEYRRENYTVAFPAISALEDRNFNGVVCYKIAYMYYHGKGISKDDALGNELFRKCYPMLGDTALELFYKGILKKEGRGVERNFEEAFQLYKRSSELGFVQAHINLGSCYREGQGVAKDLVMAFKCFKMASDKNSALGLCHVGYMYEFGLGVELNLEEAMRYYEASAKKKNAYSIQRIAMLRPSGIVTDS